MREPSFPAPPVARRVRPAAWEQRAALRPPAEAAGSDATAALRQAEAHAAAPRRGAEVTEAEVARAAAAAAMLVARAAAVRRQAGWDAPARVVPPSELPWAVVWAFHRDPTPPWPGPQRAARFARGIWQTQTAGP